ncbi:MAG: kelch repeat-containing protein [Phycisphaerae bacterium]|nr:kelch repeat-containing protein [Phycisphaerae bacterium]
MRKAMFIALASLLLIAVANAQTPAASPQVVSLKDAPANTWVRIAWSPTGGRAQPIFVYAPAIKKFVLASGIQAGGGEPPRHYDTEEFDPTTAKWINAYPPGVAGSRPESGPVGPEYSKAVAKLGYSGRQPFFKDGDALRLAAGGQWAGYQTGFEWCVNSDNGKVYAYLDGMTLAYDPAKRTWEDLKAKPRTSCRLWGSMVYDPVNKEIVHCGGDGASYEVGTWVYSVEKNEWRKLESGSAKFNELNAEAKKLCWSAKTLVGAACNRFTISETAEEAKADLKAKTTTICEEAKRLLAQVKSADLKDAEKAAGEVAVGRLEAAALAFGAVAEKLSAKVTPEVIVELRAAREKVQQAIDALCAEPSGRARSQVAYDPEHKKVVMFGGDGLEKVVADTWLYDCATRTWEQKFSMEKACPAPRAGHILAWLPKARQIVLAGGYSRIGLPQEVWAYDVAGNTWTLLLRAAGNGPQADPRNVQDGAVGEDDTIISVQGQSAGPLTTWACKVDLSKPADMSSGVGMSGQYTWNRLDPAGWEKVANPDADRMKKFYADLPANQWTAIKFARYAPGARNRWGTSAYDTARHQVLLWGGGHATSHENDVSHFSMLGGCWTVGFHPDDPIENVYASQPTPLSFQDRPHVPVHAYRGYCYDPAADRMLYFERAYDLTAREWESKPYPGLDHAGTMHSQMTATPHGAVTFSAKGFFRLDAKTRGWAKQPWDGPRPGGIWCDGDVMRYDSKRDAVWIATGKDIYRYDFATSKGEKIAVALPKCVGNFPFGAEAAYLPDADLILSMRIYPKPDGKLANIAYDPAANKFLWVDLKFVGPDGKDPGFKGNPFGWDDALTYDPELKLAVLNSSNRQEVYVLRFDRKTATMEEIKE